jgi:hypothetical protein
MKKILLVLLIFASGIICGIAVNKQFDPNQQNASVIDPDHKELAENNAALPTAEVLSKHFLPSTAPYWLYADLNQWRKNDADFRSFLEKPAVTAVSKEFCASLPQGVTQTLSGLFAGSDEMRLYLLPPKEEIPTSVFIATFKLSGATDASETPSGIEAFISANPDSATSEIHAGETIIKVIDSPLGEYAYLQDGGLLWICNNKNALEHFWNQPPPRPEGTDEVNPTHKVLSEHPDTVLALFSNSNHPGQPLPGPLGMITQRLSALGVMHPAVLFQCKDNGSGMTVIAPSETKAPWMEEWKTIDEFPFGGNDPAGLLELAIRWPNAGPPEVVNATTQTPVLKAPQPMDMTKSPGEKSKREIRKANRADQKKQISMMKKMQKEMSGEKPGKGRMTGLVNKMKLRMMSEFIPRGETIGLNIFGFYNDAPTLTLAFPGIDSNQSALKQLAAMPSVTSSSVEIAMLPGASYKFEDNPMNQMLGFEELLMIERDAITYLFDAREAAQNYLTNKDNDRSNEMRDLLDEVKTPAHLETVFSKDLFRFILDTEKEEIPGDFPHKETLEALFDELAANTKPMSLSAGLDEQVWFMETYTEDELALLVDTGLLLWAVHKFMGN